MAYFESDPSSSESSSEDETPIDDDANPADRISRLHVANGVSVKGPKKLKPDWKKFAENYFTQSSSAGSAAKGLKKPAAEKKQVANKTWKPLTDVAWDSVVSTLTTVHPTRQTVIDEQMRKFEESFSKLMLFLKEGFNLLFYGYGSKYDLLERFRVKMLADYAHMIIRGYEARQSLKSIVGCLQQGLGVTPSTANIMDQVKQLQDLLNADDTPDVVLVIYSLDGSAMRSSKVQYCLSLLAACKHVCIVASCNHIHCPLMWDPNEVARFNWLWLETTTYAPYSKELLRGESVILASQTGLTNTTHSLASLHSVWASLTENAKKIFMKMAARQLKYGKEKGYQGVSFWDLYRESRDAFLVSNESALRTLLVEFKDHRLMGTRKDKEGTELLALNLDKDTVREFLTQEGCSVPVESDDDEEEDMLDGGE